MDKAAYDLNLRPRYVRVPLSTPAAAPTFAPVPQQPSSLLVAAEELSTGSIKRNVQIAPTQAAPHSP